MSGTDDPRSSGSRSSGSHRTDAASGAPGQRPQLQDVAAAVGLSTASVSLVLRGAPGPSARTRQRVLEAAAQLGYRPNKTASLLARRRKHLLGVMLDVRNAFHAELVENAQVAAERLRYDVVLSTLTRTTDERRAVEQLLDFGCEALLLLGPEAPIADLAGLDERVPLVVVGRRIVHGGLDVVRTADDEGVGLAVDHLVALGHRWITFVDGGRGTIASDRRRGYRSAMRRHGLGDHMRVIAGDHTEQAGRRVSRSVLRGSPPTAVVTSNDRCAMGLLDGLSRADVDVPGEMSVVGYDDSPFAQLAQVDLTTVRQDAQEQAERAVAAAVERLDDGRTQHREVVLAPTLIVRGTTAPARPG